MEAVVVHEPLVVTVVVTFPPLAPSALNAGQSKVNRTPGHRSLPQLGHRLVLMPLNPKSLMVLQQA